jgi:hypothetical protein
MRSSRLLATYLNDHLAGSVAGVELARRAARSNRGTSYGDVLSDLVPQIVEDRGALQDVMRRVGVDVDRPKLALAWGAEKLGRAKLNGRLIGYSPLSRLEEFEFLLLGIEGKLLMWQALYRVAQHDGRLSEVNFELLTRRARNQRRRLGPYRLDAAHEALSD